MPSISVRWFADTSILQTRKMCSGFISNNTCQRQANVQFFNWFVLSCGHWHGSLYHLRSTATQTVPCMIQDDRILSEGPVSWNNIRNWVSPGKYQPQPEFDAEQLIVQNNLTNPIRLQIEFTKQHEIFLCLVHEYNAELRLQVSIGQRADLSCPPPVKQPIPTQTLKMKTHQGLILNLHIVLAWNACYFLKLREDLTDGLFSQVVQLFQSSLISVGH